MFLWRRRRRRDRVTLYRIILNLGLESILDFEIECVFKQFLGFRCLRNVLHFLFGDVLAVTITTQDEILRALKMNLELGEAPNVREENTQD